MNLSGVLTVRLAVRVILFGVASWFTIHGMVHGWNTLWDTSRSGRVNVVLAAVLWTAWYVVVTA